MNKNISPLGLLLLLTGLNLFNYLDRYILSAVRTPLAAEFGIGFGDSGRLFTAFMFGYFVTSPLFGFWGDRGARKWLIAAGIFVWSLFTVLSGWAVNFGQLLLFRVLVGIGEASYASICPSLISDAWEPSRRNNALSFYYTAIPVGCALGFILGGIIAAHWGWRYSFFLAGAPGLLLALTVLPFKEPRRGQSEAIDARLVSKPGIMDLLRLYKNRGYALAVGGYIAYTFALGAFSFWGPTFLEKVHHLSTAKADSLFGGIIIITGLVGTLVGGILATLWKKKQAAGYAWLISLSTLVAIPSSFMALTVARTDITIIMLTVSIFLLFMCTGPVNTLILESVPVNLRSSAMAFSIFLIHLFGDLWSPEIVGRLADFLGHDLQKSMLILPMSLLVSGFLWLSLGFKMKDRGRNI
jgi:MFS transporter, Spinster family, sphingosine-1-phosphate transporter